MGHDAATPRSAWSLLAFLTLLNVLNFVDRQLIVSFGEPITRDLGLQLWQFGLLTGFAFVMFYSCVGVLLGTAADVWNRPRLIALGLLLWSALTAASGLARGFWDLAAARLLVGVGEATLTPAAVSMLGDVFRPRQRALASGIFYLGIPLGAGLSLILAGTLGLALGGWRQCFYLLGGVGVPLAAIAWCLRDPRHGAAGGVTAKPPAGGVGAAAVSALLHSPALVLTILGGVTTLFAVGATAFDMIWLQRERGFSQKEAGLFLGTVILLGGSAGNVLGGWCGDWFQRHRPNGRLLFLALGQLVLCPAVLAFRMLPADSAWFYVAAAANAVQVTFFYGPLFASVQELSPAGVRSTMIAVLIFGHNLLGYAPGSFVAGKLSGGLAGRVAEPISWGLFITGLAGLLAVPLFLLAAWRAPADAARARRKEVPS
jgi:MFS family permease